MPMEKDKFNKIIILVFVFLICLYGLYNYFYIKKYFSIPGEGDEARHLIFTHDYYEILKGFPEKNVLYEFIKIVNVYPPLYFVSAAIFALFVGFSKLNLTMINILYFFIMLISTYFIGRRISASKLTALFSIFILSMFPMIFGMSRWFMLDFALTAMVTLSICCLLYSEDFTNRKFSLFFGLSSALAMLTKWSAFIFILGAFLYIIFNILFNSKRFPRKQLFNILYASFFVFVLAGSWYVYFFYQLRPLTKLLEYLRVGQLRLHWVQFPWNSLSGLLYYARTLFPYQISFNFSILFLIAIPFFIKSKIKFKNFIICWILISYAILTIIENKWPRYIMPVLPAISLVIAIGIEQIKFRNIKLIIYLFVVIVGLLQYAFPVHFFKAERDKGEFYIYFDVDPLYSEDKKITDIYYDIINEINYFIEREKPENTTNLGIICPVAINLVGYFFSLEKQDIHIYPFYERPIDFLEKVDQFDFLILRTSTGNWPKKQDIENEFRHFRLDKVLNLNDDDYIKFAQSFERLKNTFTPIKLVKNYHNSYIYLLIKNSRIKGKGIEYINNTAVLETGDIKINFLDGIVNLYYKGRELTEYNGLRSRLYVNGTYYDSSNAIWRVEKISPAELLATASWPGFPLQQVWRLSLKDSHLEWQIELEAEKQIFISEIDAWVGLKGEYKDWVSLGSQGSIPRLYPWHKDAGIDLKGPSHFIGLSMTPTKEGSLPAIIFNLQKDTQLNMASLRMFKEPDAKFKSSLMLLADSRIKQPIFIKGRRLLLSAQLFVFDKQENLIKYVREARSPLEIEQGDLKLFFSEGKGQIIYKGRELTKDDGISILLLSSNKWHDSSNEASYNIKKLTSNELTIECKWLNLPISHFLKFEIKDENTIDCTIDMEIYEDVELKQQSFVLMFSEDYKYYTISPERKKMSFPSQHKKAYTWEDLWHGSIKLVPAVGVVNDNGNEIILDCSSMPPEFHTVIANTNSLHNARALIYNKDSWDNAKIKKGTYSFFVGKLKINSK